MKVIRVKLHQETANYRVPASHGFRESYPLPPYSTVIGMVHYLCDFHEYHPMQVSIQGSYVSTTSDFFTRYEFKNGMKFDPGRHQLNAEGFGISRGIGHVQFLYDVNLILHIKPNDESELDTIYHALANTPLTKTRFDERNIHGIRLVKMMAKGNNSLPVSLVFDYIRNKKGNKAIILHLDDYDEKKENSSERIGWIYDCDYEF